MIKILKLCSLFIIWLIIHTNKYIITLFYFCVIVYTCWFSLLMFCFCTTSTKCFLRSVLYRCISWKLNGIFFGLKFRKAMYSPFSPKKVTIICKIHDTALVQTLYQYTYTYTVIILYLLGSDLSTDMPMITLFPYIIVKPSVKVKVLCILVSLVKHVMGLPSGHSWSIFLIEQE